MAVHLTWRRIVLMAAGIAALAALLWWVYARFLMSEEDKIRGAIRAAAQGARERKASDVTVRLHSDFKFRNLSKDEIHGLLIRYLWQEFQVVEVILQEPILVKLEKDRKRARAEFRVTVRCKQVPEDKVWVDITEIAGGHQYALTMEKTDEGWKVVAAEASD